MANKQYKSVSDMVRDIAPDQEFRGAFEDCIAKRRVIKELMARRAVSGLSQGEVGDRMGCSQSRVSKLEKSLDDDVRVGELRAYADAVGCELISGVVPRDMKPVDKVKCHVFSIKKHMDDLARLAKADATIAGGVTAFFMELVVNFFSLLGDSAKLLPKKPDGTPAFRIEVGHIDTQSDDTLEACFVESDRLEMTCCQPR